MRNPQAAAALLAFATVTPQCASWFDKNKRVLMVLDDDFCPTNTPEFLVERLVSTTLDQWSRGICWTTLSFVCLRWLFWVETNGPFKRNIGKYSLRGSSGYGILIFVLFYQGKSPLHKPTIWDIFFWGVTCQTMIGWQLMLVVKRHF